MSFANGTSDPFAYARAALEGECATLSSTGHSRNEQTNRSGFACGQFIPGGLLDRDEVEHRLMNAAEASGIVRKDGRAAVVASLRSGIEAGMLQPRNMPSNGSTPRGKIHVLRPRPKLSDVDLPAWTEPDPETGKPKFISVGKPEPMQFEDEARRHRYERDGEAVRFKVKSTSGRFTDWYRVRRPSDGVIGWQAKKPDGFVPIPYLSPGARNPFDVERRGEDLVWAEGEKDADALHAKRFLAFTFGSASDVPDVSELLSDHAVIIAVDNDEAGRKSITRKVGAAIQAGARSIRLVQFTELAEGGDCADFFEAGGDAEEFINKAERIDPAKWRAEQEEKGGQAEDAAGPQEGAQAPADELSRLNAEYCVVLDTGRARVLHFEVARQEKHSREVASFLSFEDFRNFYMNRFVVVNEKKVPLGHWWLRHPDRRQYRGLTFEPAAEREIDGRLNLWRGWGVEPKAGDWSLMEAHISEVLASGDETFAGYIMRWCAWAVQHPAERAEAALVFKGKRGTGKGTLGNALCRIFGQHGTHISTAEHLAGRFNSHLRDACFLFADEAYWPGDKGAEGSLKRLVTEPDLFIEGKGKDGVTVPNMLHVLMASNDDWVVPAGEDERRYAVFAVSDCHKQDEAWFRPLNDQMDAGGYEAMLFDLLRVDLGDWHPRRVIRTDALVEQQSRGLGPEDAWWCELLQTGVLWGADPKRPDCAVSNGWEEEKEVFSGTRMVKHKALYDQAREVSPRLKGLSDHLLGTVLAKHGCSNAKKVMRRRGWRFPPLDEARRKWECRFPGWKWQDPDIATWQAEDGE